MGFFTAPFGQERFPKCCISIYEKYMVITAMHKKKTITGLNIPMHGVGLLFPDIIVF